MSEMTPLSGPHNFPPGLSSGHPVVVIDPRKLAEFMRSPQGPVYRDMARRAARVKEEARRLVGVYVPPDAYSAANRKRRPGTLRDSIVTRVTEQGGLPVWTVGSQDPIALIHHEGTIPHPIRARLKPLLVFFWPNGYDGARVYAFKSVNHPGTKPNRFLTNAMRVFGGS